MIKRTIISLFLALSLFNVNQKSRAMVYNNNNQPQQPVIQKKGFWDCMHAVGSSIGSVASYIANGAVTVATPFYQPFANNPKKTLALLTLIAIYYYKPELFTEAQTYLIKAIIPKIKTFAGNQIENATTMLSNMCKTSTEFFGNAYTASTNFFSTNTNKIYNYWYAGAEQAKVLVEQQKAFHQAFGKCLKDNIFKSESIPTGILSKDVDAFKKQSTVKAFNTCLPKIMEQFPTLNINIASLKETFTYLLND